MYFTKIEYFIRYSKWSTVIDSTHTKNSDNAYSQKYAWWSEQRLQNSSNLESKGQKFQF